MTTTTGSIAVRLRTGKKKKKKKWPRLVRKHVSVMPGMTVVAASVQEMVREGFRKAKESLDEGKK